MNDKCKLCDEPIPRLAIHLSNEIAIDRGYCSWICLTLDFGHTEALKLLRMLNIDLDGHSH